MNRYQFEQVARRMERRYGKLRKGEEEEFALLKRQSGIALLNLYNHYVSALKGTSKYDYEKNKQRLTTLYGDLAVEETVANKKSLTFVSGIFYLLDSFHLCEK